MIEIAKMAALVAIAAAASILVRPVRAPSSITTIVVERRLSLPQRTVRVTQHEVLYQGTVVAHVPACPDSPCFKLDELFHQLEVPEPAAPRGAFEPARLVLVELDASTDIETERQVLDTIAAAGYWPVVTYIES